METSSVARIFSPAVFADLVPAVVVWEPATKFMVTRLDGAPHLLRPRNGDWEVVRPLCASNLFERPMVRALLIREGNLIGKE